MLHYTVLFSFKCVHNSFEDGSYQFKGHTPFIGSLLRIYADRQARNNALVTCPAWVVLGLESTLRKAAAAKCKSKMNGLYKVLYSSQIHKNSIDKCVNPQVHWMKGYLDCNIKGPHLAISKWTRAQLQITRLAHGQNILIRSICFEEKIVTVLAHQINKSLQTQLELAFMMDERHSL